MSCGEQNRMSTSKSEVMVLSWKKVECPLCIRDQLLTQIEEFKYFGVLLTSETDKKKLHYNDIQAQKRNYICWHPMISTSLCLLSILNLIIIRLFSVCLQKFPCPLTEDHRLHFPSRSLSQWCKTGAHKPPVIPEKVAEGPEKMWLSASSLPRTQPCCWVSAPSASNTSLSSWLAMVYRWHFTVHLYKKTCISTTLP